MVSFAGLCGTSSFELVTPDGVVPLCFLNVGILGANTVFLLVLGLFRLDQLWTRAQQPIAMTRLQQTKFLLSSWLALMPIVHLIGHWIQGRLEYHTGVGDFYLILSWVFALNLAHYEYSRAERNSWVLRTWWTTSFIFYAFLLQSEVDLSQLGKGFGFDFAIALLSLPAGVLICIIGLFANRIQETYEQILDGPDEKATLEDQKVDPEGRAGLFSRFTFGWLNPLLFLGFKRPLNSEDLYELPGDCRSASIARGFEPTWDQEKRALSPSLPRALRRTFARTFLACGVYKGIQDLLLFAGPVLLQEIIKFISNPAADVSWGFFLVFLLFATSCIQSLSLHQYFYVGFKTGMRARAALVNVIYRKAFLLSTKGDRTAPSEKSLTCRVSMQTECKSCCLTCT